MALLNAARRFTPSRIAATIALLAAAGCMLAGHADVRAKLAFNHEKHVVEQHRGYVDENRPEMGHGERPSGVVIQS